MCIDISWRGEVIITVNVKQKQQHGWMDHTLFTIISIDTKRHEKMTVLFFIFRQNAVYITNQNSHNNISITIYSLACMGSFQYDLRNVKTAIKVNNKGNVPRIIWALWVFFCTPITTTYTCFILFSWAATKRLTYCT